MTHAWRVEAKPLETNFCPLREGENVSGPGVVGFAGDGGCAGSIKCGRLGMGVTFGAEKAELVGGPGVWGARTRNRWEEMTGPGTAVCAGV
jgi:hypothetical protein